MPDMAKARPHTFFRSMAICIKAAAPNIMGTQGKTKQMSNNIEYKLRIGCGTDDKSGFVANSYIDIIKKGIKDRLVKNVATAMRLFFLT